MSRYLDRYISRAQKQNLPGVAAAALKQKSIRYGWLAEVIGRAPQPVPGAQYVLNMDRSKSRRRSFFKHARSLGIEPIRQTAIDASDPGTDVKALMPQDLLEKLSPDGAFRPGVIACALGHMAMWRAFLASDSPLGVFYEDDAQPFIDPLRFLAVLPPPEEWELIFIGERTEPIHADAGEGYLSLDDAIASRFKQMGALDHRHAPGADAYMLSRPGAARLLAAIEEAGIRAGVDFMMTFNALECEVASGFPRLDDHYNRGFGSDKRASIAPLAAYTPPCALSGLHDVPSTLSKERTAHKARTSKAEAST